MDETSQEINSKRLHESYMLHIIHISRTKILCPASFILPTICSHSKLFDLCVTVFHDHKPLIMYQSNYHQK